MIIFMTKKQRDAHRRAVRCEHFQEIFENHMVDAISTAVAAYFVVMVTGMFTNKFCSDEPAKAAAPEAEPDSKSSENKDS